MTPKFTYIKLVQSVWDEKISFVATSYYADDQLIGLTSIINYLHQELVIEGNFNLYIFFWRKL